MKAAILKVPQNIAQLPLETVDIASPEPIAGHVLLRVRACGICRTYLHIVEGDLLPARACLIPGHQIVGVVVGGATAELPLGTRVCVSWLGDTDGLRPYCEHGPETP